MANRINTWCQKCLIFEDVVHSTSLSDPISCAGISDYYIDCGITSLESAGTVNCFIEKTGSEQGDKIKRVKLEIKMVKDQLEKLSATEQRLMDEYEKLK